MRIKLGVVIALSLAIAPPLFAKPNGASSPFESDRAAWSLGAGFSRLGLDGIDDSSVTVVTSKLSIRYPALDQLFVSLDLPFSATFDDDAEDATLGSPTLSVDYVGRSDHLAYRVGLTYSPPLREIDDLEELEDFLIGGLGAFTRGFRDLNLWIPFTTTIGVPARIEQMVTPKLRIASSFSILRYSVVDDDAGGGDDEGDAVWQYGITPEIAFLLEHGLIGVDLSLVLVDAGDETDTIEALGFFARFGERVYLEPRLLLPFDDDIDVWTVIVDFGGTL